MAVVARYHGIVRRAAVRELCNRGIIIIYDMTRSLAVVVKIRYTLLA